VHSNERPIILFRPSSWRPQQLTPRAITLAQQAKANASEDELAKQNTGEDEGRGGGGGEDEDEEDEAEGDEDDEDRDPAPHGLRCMDPTDPATRNSCPTSTNEFPPTQPEKQRLKMKVGRKKREKEGGEGGGSRSSPARVQRPQSDLETQRGGVYYRPSLLGVWCVCAGPKGPVVAR
jgi:hypothetical protein